MRVHHDKHHQTYVDNLNAALTGQDKWLNMKVEDILRNLNKIPEEIRTKVRNQGGGVTNHSMFWQIMSPPQNEDIEPSGDLIKAINNTFGSLINFQEKFTQIAMGRFGSGWAWLILDQGQLALMDTPNQDTPLMDHQLPLLCLDVWEHAYYLKYQNRRAEYIKAWWHVVNWLEVKTRFEKGLENI